jgi:N-hydroxyarylamine O-acetyltransferase
MNVDAYLARIGLNRPPSPDEAGLAALLERHLMAAPFENLDILAGRPLSLQPDDLFDKIVLRGRGGYCYELNTLFHRLLTRLGFRADIVAGRVFNPKRNRFGPPLDHMALIVHLDGPHLVDVGFGDSFREPLAVPGRDAGGYRVRPRPDLGPDEYVMEKRDGDWKVKYRFSAAPRKAADFEAANRRQQRDPDSLFHKGILCSIAVNDGGLTLFGTRLIHSRPGGSTTTLVQPRDRPRILAERFGLRPNFDVISMP